MGLASCTGSIARVWCSFYWPFFLDYSLLAFSKASANGNLFMGEGGSRERGGFKRCFSLILKYYSSLILSSSVETIKRDDTIERPDRIRNLKFIQLIVVNKLFPTL